MAETPQQIVDRVLREHKRYTGDGLPNEPVNAPLPVGDPQSGPHNPKKKDLRLGLKETLHGAAEETARAADEADRSEAAAAIAQQGGSGLAEFETRALAEAWPGVDPMPESIVLRGDAHAGDGQGGTFVRDAVSADIMVVAGDNYGRTSATSVVLTVGTGGQFATINAALAAASHLRQRDYVAGGLAVSIQLLSGFVMAEQVYVKGVDLGFVTITSEDSEVSIQRSALNDTLILDGDVRSWAFRADNAVAPTIGVLFNMDSSGVGAGRDAFLYMNGASGAILPGAGCINSGSRGIFAIYGSEVVANGTIFDDGGNYAFYLSHASNISAELASAQRNNNGAVYAIWNSKGSFKRAILTDTINGNGVRVRDGSVVDAREADTSRSGESGFYASHASTINARSAVADDCGQNGVLSERASTVDFQAGHATGCGSYGLFARGSSRIEATTADVTGAGTAGARAELSSNINCANVIANNCPVGISAVSGSTISAQNSYADDCSSNAIVVSSGSTVDANGGRGRDAGGVSVIVQGASRFNGGGFDGIRASLQGIRVRGVSAASIQGANFRKNEAQDESGTNADIVVYEGSFVDAVSAIGGTNVAEANTLSRNGVVFR